MDNEQITRILGNIANEDIERVNVLAAISSDRVSEETAVYGISEAVNDDEYGMKHLPEWLSDIADGAKDIYIRHVEMTKTLDETRSKLAKAEQDRETYQRMWQRSEAKKEELIALNKSLLAFIQNALDSYAV